MYTDKCEHCKYRDRSKYKECPDFVPKTDNPDSGRLVNRQTIVKGMKLLYCPSCNRYFRVYLTAVPRCYWCGTELLGC